MFALLGVASLPVFEPTITMAALIEANEPPAALIGRALPMTVSFALATASLLSLLYGRSWPHFGTLLLCCSTLVLVLGLNFSVIGLVDIPLRSAYIVAELLALIAVLNLAYVADLSTLQHRQLSPRPTPAAAPLPERERRHDPSARRATGRAREAARDQLDAAEELFPRYGAKLYLDQSMAKKEILRA